MRVEDRSATAYEIGQSVDVQEDVRDPAERNLRMFELATGVRFDTCPWQALRDPFVLEVMGAYRWFQKGALYERYPEGTPAIVLRALEVYDAALERVRAFDAEERRKEAEAEARRREEELAARGGRRFPRGFS